MYHGWDTWVVFAFIEPGGFTCGNEAQKPRFAAAFLAPLSVAMATRSYIVVLLSRHNSRNKNRTSIELPDTKDSFFCAIKYSTLTFVNHEFPA